ncbi:MAG: OmpH family outer membrane protein [Fimbriimonadia bacterium]|nr:OmpH family outer membrane protein [Fimbriimonadia bacterium]
MRMFFLGLAAALTMTLASAQSYGVVDFARVINEADVAKKNLTELEQLQQRYNTLLQNLQANLLLKDDERQELYGVITSATAPTEAQQKRVQDITALSQQRAQELATLRQKPTPSETEKLALDQYTQMETKSREALQGLAQQLDAQLQDRLQKSRQEVRTQVKDAIAAVAKEKKITLVFDTEAVLFCDNDLTDEVIKRINKK